MPPFLAVLAIGLLATVASGATRQQGGRAVCVCETVPSYIVERHQDDGRWPADADGAPSAADLRVSTWMLLVDLGDGSTLRRGSHSDRIAKTIRWLLAQQDRSGRFAPRADADWLLDHAMTTCALAEAMRGSNHGELVEPLRRATAALCREVAVRRPAVDDEVRLWCTMTAEVLRATEFHREAVYSIRATIALESLHMHPFPKDHELVEFFGSYPSLADAGVPWCYNDITFDWSQGADRVEVEIRPGYGMVRIAWTQAGLLRVRLDLQAVTGLMLEREEGQDTLLLRLGGHRSGDLRFRLAPTVCLQWSTEA